MLLIPCPWCGPRDEVEFHYGGQAHVAYPDGPRGALRRASGPGTCSSATTPRVPSPSAGCHAAGCRRWFNADPRHRDEPDARRLPPRRARSR